MHRRCVGALFISFCTNRDNHTRPPGTEDGLEPPLPLYDYSPVYRPGLFPLPPRLAAGPAVSHLSTRWSNASVSATDADWTPTVALGKPTRASACILPAETSLPMPPHPPEECRTVMAGVCDQAL